MAIAAGGSIAGKIADLELLNKIPKSLPAYIFVLHLKSFFMLSWSVGRLNKSKPVRCPEDGKY